MHFPHSLLPSTFHRLMLCCPCGPGPLWAPPCLLRGSCGQWSVRADLGWPLPQVSGQCRDSLACALSGQGCPAGAVGSLEAGGYVLLACWAHSPPSVLLPPGVPLCTPPSPSPSSGCLMVPGGFLPASEPLLVMKMPVLLGLRLATPSRCQFFPGCLRRSQPHHPRP